MVGLIRGFILCAFFVSVAGIALAGDKAGAPLQAPPKAKQEPVVEMMHGHKIVDEYRWLENADDPATQQFTRDQLAYMHALLDKQPQREAIHKRLSELLTIGSLGAPQPAGKLYFYTRREGTQNQPILYVREGVNGSDRTLVDVNKLAADGTVALDWWHASHSGKYVVYGTSPGGSEISMLHVIETASGKLLPDMIDRARAASVVWFKDDSGFYYTKYPRPGEVEKGQELYNRHVFVHKLGTDPDGSKDELIFGQGRDPQEWPQISGSDDGRWLVITAEQGWAKSELHLMDTSNGKIMPVAVGKESLYSGEAFKGELFILTNEGSPRFRVYKVAAEKPERENWKEIIPQSDAVIKSAQVVGGKLFILYEKDATSRLHIFDLDGKHLSEIKLPALGTIEDIGGDWESKEAFIGFQSYTSPDTVFRYDLASGKTSEWGRVKSDIDSDNYQVRQVFYPSKDGTKIPMFIVAKKGLRLDGKNPTILTGYGGFNISRTPTFFDWANIWLEHGGVLADANLRGGSEYGEEWHRAGMLEKKQNVFDDYIAAAEYLIAQKYTSKDHLAIYGRSNGGLLTGAALTQRPELFRAVVCGVPLLDMLRYQRFQIAKLWIPEYGSAEDPKQFDWLYAYSPYHHVKPKTLYPATFFFASAGDTRVDPLHAKKMTALMQAEAANGPDRPILLRIEPKAGHGAGKPVSKKIDEWTDIFTFLFWQLNVK